MPIAPEQLKPGIKVRLEDGNYWVVSIESARVTLSRSKWAKKPRWWVPLDFFCEKAEILPSMAGWAAHGGWRPR